MSLLSPYTPPLSSPSHSRHRYQVVRAQACHCSANGSQKDWVGVLVQVIEPDREPATQVFTPRYLFLSMYGKSGGRLQGGRPGTLLSWHEAERAYEAKVREKLTRHYYTPVPFEPFLSAFPLPLELSTTVPVSTDAGFEPASPPSLGILACRIEASTTWEQFVSPCYGVTEKANGERCLLSFDGNQLRAYNRRGQPESPVPEQAQILQAFERPFLLDGERLTGSEQGQYVLFDILTWDGLDLRGWSYHQRIHFLQDRCRQAGLIREVIPTPKLSDARANSESNGIMLLTPQSGVHLFEVLTSVREQAGEGLIIRDLSQSYGELQAVYKYKFTAEIDAVVIGIKPGSGGGSLKLGVRRPSDHAVISIGQVRSGLNEEQMTALTVWFLAGHLTVLKVEYLPARTVGLSLVEARTQWKWIREDKLAWECTTDQFLEQFGTDKTELIHHAAPLSGMSFPNPVEEGVSASIGEEAAGGGQEQSRAPSAAESVPGASVALPQTLPPEQEQDSVEPVRPDPIAPGREQGYLVPVVVTTLEEYEVLERLLEAPHTMLVDVRKLARSQAKEVPALRISALRARFGMKYLPLGSTLGNKLEHRDWNGVCEFYALDAGIATLSLLLERGLRVILLSRVRPTFGRSYTYHLSLLLSHLAQRGVRFSLLSLQAALVEPTAEPLSSHHEA